MQKGVELGLKDVHDDKFWDLSAYVEHNKNLKAEVQRDENRTAVREIPLNRINDTFVPYKHADTYKSAPIAQRQQQSTVFEYVPESRMFVMDVKLSASSARSASDFEEKSAEFRKAQGEEAPFADFYAPSPVYYNLGPQASEYYLWWRDSFCRGVSLRSSWSYVSLYLSELINCDSGDFFENVRVMWRIYEVYSEKDSVLYIPDVETKLPEIICDYSLIHDLGFPDDVSEKAICKAAKMARFKEFFFDREHPASTITLLASLCSEYDYDKSKFASKITVGNAKAYIYGAIKYCSDKAVAEGFDHPFAGSFKERTTITRHSYSDFIFVLPKYTYVIKVDFCSVNRSYILRNTVTGIIKQCENRLRTHSGIKAKLRIFSLEPFFRDAVDEYLDGSLPRVVLYKPEKKKPEPEYERLYEREATEFSLDNAKKIEARSWTVTEKLVEGMDGYELEGTEKSDQNTGRGLTADKDFGTKAYIEPENSADNSATQGFGDELSDIIAIFPDVKDFLVAVYLKDYAVMMREADRIGLPVSLIVDRINEAAFDVIGDTLIEESDDGYEIIPDYVQLFEGIGS